jgi:DSF synthase
MSVAQTLHRNDACKTLRIVENLAANVFWCNMHAHLASAPGRACFSTQLIDDILVYQRDLGNRINVRRQAGDDGLAHVVLASDDAAFNLGGDLDLFSRLIRSGDRVGLLDYANRCVRGVHAFHSGLQAGAHTIALVQGDALGGGFEAALSCHTIVAEEDVQMGLPEVLFDLFPGMGAYSFLCERIPPHAAERLMLEGQVYTSQELHRMGLVDVVAPKGQGVQAVEAVIRANNRIPHARAAMHQVRGLRSPTTLDELSRITEVWVDTALQLGEKSLRTMDRLVRAQCRRAGSAVA